MIAKVIYKIKIKIEENIDMKRLKISNILTILYIRIPINESFGDLSILCAYEKTEMTSSICFPFTGIERF